MLLVDETLAGLEYSKVWWELLREDYGRDVISSLGGSQSPSRLSRGCRGSAAGSWAGRGAQSRLWIPCIVHMCKDAEYLGDCVKSE